MGAPQVACSITEMTEVRRRWGRFYIPFLSRNFVDNGRVSSTFLPPIVNAAADLLSHADADWTPVVYGSGTPSALPVQAVRVDDVPDIIRSRRWSSTGVRQTVDVTP